MKEKDKEFLRNHPYFRGEGKNRFYLKHEGNLYSLNLSYDVENKYPVKYVIHNNDFPKIWHTEKWFQELYVEVNELYFKLNRVKMITKAVKRSIENIVHFSCIGQKDGEKVKMLLAEINTCQKKCMSKKYESTLLRIKEKLEHEQYEVSLREENGEELSLTIY